MKKNQRVNPIIHYLMISSLLIIFLILLTSWFLWFYYYHDIIEILLVNFTFKNFSIVILAFSGLAFFFASILLCNPKKNIYNNLFSLLSFVLSFIIIATSLFFYSKFKIDNLLVIFLPWIGIIVATGFLFVTSSINLIFNEKRIQQNQKINSTSTNLESKNNIINSNQTNNSDSKDLQTKEIQQSTLNLKAKKEQNFNISAFSIEENNEVTNSFIKLKNNNKAKLLNPEWTTQQIKQIWETAEIIPGVDKTLYRKDYAGAWMYFSAFINNPNDAIDNFRSYSWTIVQHKSLSKNDSDTIENLRAMNIGNALSKGENYPKWETEISSCGNENILKKQLWNE